MRISKNSYRLQTTLNSIRPKAMGERTSCETTEAISNQRSAGLWEEPFSEEPKLISDGLRHDNRMGIVCPSFGIRSGEIDIQIGGRRNS
jgi:hypothetical protein